MPDAGSHHASSNYAERRRSLRNIGRIIATRLREAARNTCAALVAGGIIQWAADRVSVDTRVLPGWPALQELGEELLQPALLGGYALIATLLFQARAFRWIAPVIGSLVLAVVLGTVGQVVAPPSRAAEGVRTPPPVTTTPPPSGHAASDRGSTINGWTKMGRFIFAASGVLLVIGICAFLGIAVVGTVFDDRLTETMLDPWAEIDREEAKRLDLSGLPGSGLSEAMEEGGSITLGFGATPDPGQDAAWAAHLEKLGEQKKGDG